MLFRLRLRARRRQGPRIASRTTAATPPTTPPAIAPASDFLCDGAAAVGTDVMRTTVEVLGCTIAEPETIHDNKVGKITTGKNDLFYLGLSELLAN